MAALGIGGHFLQTLSGHLKLPSRMLCFERRSVKFRIAPVGKFILI